MKKNYKHAPVSAPMLSALLIVSLLAGLLSGCRNKAVPDPTPTESLMIEPSPEATSDSAISDDTLVLTVDDKPVYWDELKYWIFSSLSYIGLDPYSEIDWTGTYEGQTLSDFAVSEAVKAVRLYKTIESKCDELSVTLSDKDREDIAAILENGLAQFGSKEEYLEFLKANMLNERLLEYIYTVSYLNNNLMTNMYGENGSKVSDEEALAFGNENGYYRAKHILIKTVDYYGTELSQEQLDENKDKLLGILADIMSAEDQEARFDELMNESSEDTGKEAYPDGYQFNANTINFNENFLNEAISLEIGGISQEIIEMEWMGYTILMRLPLDPDLAMISDNGGTLRSITALTRFQTLQDAWAEESAIVYEDVFYTIKPEEIF